MQSTISNALSPSNASHKDPQSKTEAYTSADPAHEPGVVIIGKIDEVCEEDDKKDNENSEEARWRPRGASEIRVATATKPKPNPKPTNGSTNQQTGSRT